MKQIKFLIIILLSLSVVVGCNSNKTEYNNEMVQITEKGKLEKINNGYVFFSIKDCPLCTELSPLIKKEIMNKKIDVYHFDIYTLLNDEIYTNKELQNICIKYNIQSAPTIIKLKNGKEINRFPSSYNQKIDELSNELKNFLKENK